MKEERVEGHWIVAEVVELEGFSVFEMRREKEVKKKVKERGKEKEEYIYLQILREIDSLDDELGLSTLRKKNKKLKMTQGLGKKKVGGVSVVFQVVFSSEEKYLGKKLE